MQAVLSQRSNNECELCHTKGMLNPYFIPESPDTSANSYVHVCGTCEDNIAKQKNCDLSHFRCLANCMWSPTAAVQVLSYRLLHNCLPEPWAQDALDMLYLEDDLLQWAQAGLLADKVPTTDVNGLTLQAGDAVTIIKDLVVKGASFTAKRGTPVRNISLSDNPLHIEGKVNGQRIVIISAYTKKN